MALYGTDRSFHAFRQHVADYLEAEISFYKQFITNPPGPEGYVRNLRKDGVWADDIELQVMSEIYDCSIEVYSESTTPLKVFNEAPKAIQMRVRLHYLGGCHYDLIWDPRRTSYPLQGQNFGSIEAASVAKAKDRLKKPQVAAPKPQFSETALASRYRFERFMTKSMAQGVVNSLSTLEQDFDKLTKDVMKEQEVQMTEDEILKKVMAESLKTAYPVQKQGQAGVSAPHSAKRDVAMLKDRVALIMQLESMGYQVAECQAALTQLHGTPTISQVIDKIIANREKQLYLFY